MMVMWLNGVNKTAWFIVFPISLFFRYAKWFQVDSN